MAANGLKPSQGEAGAERDRVLFSDADVECAVRKRVGKFVNAGA